MDTTRLIDISNVNNIPTKKINNYFPCLCNGKIDMGLYKVWNLNNWGIEFHILRNDFIKSSQIFDINAKEHISLSFIIYKTDEIISTGHIIYDTTNGNIKYFECQCEFNIEREVKSFITNIINLFEEINFIEYFNAIHTNGPTRKQKISNTISKKIIDFEEQKEQPIYVPKRKNKQKRTKYKNTHKIEKVTYKTEMWERAGYYRYDGTYVKPCTCHRHTE